MSNSVSDCWGPRAASGPHNTGDQLRGAPPSRAPPAQASRQESMPQDQAPLGSCIPLFCGLMPQGYWPLALRAHWADDAPSAVLGTNRKVHVQTSQPMVELTGFLPGPDARTTAPRQLPWDHIVKK